MTVFTMLIHRFLLPLLLTVCLSLFAPLLGADEPLPLGASLPEVSASDQDGQVRELAAEFGQGWLLVFFYPRADTPGCTAQACSLRDAYEEFAEAGVRVIGVSTDPVERQHAFHRRHELPYILLADPQAEVVGAFGVPLRRGAARRQAFLFRDGVLVWRDLQASTRRQAEDVREAIAAVD